MDQVAQGRKAFEEHAWGDAYRGLAAADAEQPLAAEDLRRLATAGYLIGEPAAAAAAWERAYGAFLDRGETDRAVRCAFWLVLSLALRGEHARAGGWLARARGALDEAGLDCVECGYVRLPVGLQALGGGDPDAAYAEFERITATADRFDDPDLRALGRLGLGQALVARGDAVRGTALLDEVMVVVTTGEVSAVATGIVYCAVILACRQLFDLRRAREWTAVLSRWCNSQQELKPYRGQCLVHRSEIMQLRGAWAEAMDEVQQACEHLADPPGDPALGMALYQRAELLRLRGDFSRAERTYRQASRSGHAVHPGLALLRLAQGRVTDALAAMRRVVEEEAEGAVERARVLAAYVEIALAAGDLATADTAATELERIAADFDSPYLRAVVAYARGSVALATGDPATAGTALRRSFHAWQELDVPYETGRVRVLLAGVCRALGDHDTAEVELDAAGRVFEQLGAAPAQAQVRALARPADRRGTGELTPRELQVLRLLATGATNREVADELVISEKTVARHVANMFTKLGVSSRAAATAYAYRHGLV